MASILKVDTLTGVTTAGSISVTGEGNSTTTNLQQGLGKAWANLSGSNSPVVDDSLNVGSITDTGTGGVRFNWTNSMGNANYACLHGIMQDGNTGYARGASGTQLISVTTALLEVLQIYGSNASSDGAATGSAVHDSMAIMGDLA